MTNLMTRFPWGFSALLSRRWVLAVALTGFVLHSNAASHFIVTPEGYENKVGSTVGAPGFTGGNTEHGTFRLQQVVSAQEFRTISTPILISGLALREAFRSEGGFSGYITNELFLSTTQKSPDGLSRAFAENIGPDQTLVLPRGNGTSFSGSSGGGVGPAPFFTRLQFAQPFFYDPKAGNLLLDMRSYGAHYEQFVSVRPLDAAREVGDGVSMVWVEDVDSPNGTLGTEGYIIRFEYTPVPEPAGVLWLAGACTLAAVLVRRRSELKTKQGGRNHVAR